MGCAQEYHFRSMRTGIIDSFFPSSSTKSRSKQAPHVSGLRDEGGMTISRRPNSRPSKEKAPGPSNASATAVIIIPEAISLTPCKVQEGVGNQESAMPRKQNPTSRAAIGVRNPAVRAVPLMIKTRPSSNFSEDELKGPERQKIPPAAAERPTAARRNSKPTPGLPPGNVEYNLCSANLPGAHKNVGQRTIRRCAWRLKSHIAASFCTTFEVSVCALRAESIF